MITLLRIIFCHFIGDYVLQSEYIANTKGHNWYHLLVHCTLYIIPFAFVFGINYKLLIIFISHIIIDAGKARYKKINYATDQILHFIVGLIYFIN
jgi:hypothetical protein